MLLLKCKKNSWEGVFFYKQANSKHVLITFLKFAEHLSCQTPLDARLYTHKIVYIIFQDYMTAHINKILS